nr:immunoglobulin light chain junction region [Macaca mulatta]MOX34983.1 immunoglobulin light chain junction region [Macaca mulatta]MOX35641.1 immunoglobulin light chain junction region [Macaca mulatta]
EYYCWLFYNGPYIF